MLENIILTISVDIFWSLATNLVYITTISVKIMTILVKITTISGKMKGFMLKITVFNHHF